MTKTSLSSLVQPVDFTPLRDDESIIGFHHTRNYQIRALDSDGWCGISETRWTWVEAVDVARRYLRNGSHHIEITGIEAAGQGYFPAKHTLLFSLVADSV